MIDEQRRPLLSQSKQDDDDPSRDVQYGTHQSHSQICEPVQNSHLLANTLRPPDAYDGNQYWADLSDGDRRKFAKQQYRREAKNDFDQVYRMFKTNPLEPLRAYVRNYVAAGAGLFAEGNVLFSVGNTMPLLKALWPQCWLYYSICDSKMIDAIKYMEILGIIFGQLTVGLLGDRLGKRWGLIQDAAFMLVGTILLTSMWGTTLSGWTIMYGISIFVFAYGVGGEYPMTSTTSMEKYDGKEDRLHRGRNVLLAFLMQGWGQLVNQLALIILLFLFNKSIDYPYGEGATQLTFRISFAIAALALVYVLYLRIQPSDNSQTKPQRRSGTLRQVVGHYWHRILATSLCWFCSDFPFYGNQVFRNQLLELVTGAPPDQVRILWLYNLINIGCELLGYYLAALLIDHKAYGRWRMQMVGFAMMLIIFGTTAGGFSMLNQPGTGAKIFQALYFFSNFWIQFGPNSTTFLVAGEVYPPSVRATLHGFSAAIGKIGALAATVLYNYIDDRTKFILMAVCTLVGLLLTIVFIPDTTGLDLDEQARYWQLVIRGKGDQYHGVAIHPQHLSWYEHHILRRSDQYDVEMDQKAKLAELRSQYQEARKGDEWQAATEDASDYLDPDIVKFFELEQSTQG